jgi:hypothetical protein
LVVIGIALACPLPGFRLTGSFGLIEGDVELQVSSNWLPDLTIACNGFGIGIETAMAWLLPTSTSCRVAGALTLASPMELLPDAIDRTRRFILATLPLASGPISNSIVCP